MTPWPHRTGENEYEKRFFKATMIAALALPFSGFQASADTAVQKACEAAHQLSDENRKVEAGTIIPASDGDPEEALRIYDERLVEPLGDEFYLDACNAASLLWRVEMQGVDVSQRWQHLFSLTQHHLKDQDLLFPSLHYLMVAARATGKKSVEVLEVYRDWGRHRTTQGEICARVGETLATAIVELERENFKTSHELFEKALPETYRIGGSNEQRQLFNQLSDYALSRATR